MIVIAAFMLRSALRLTVLIILVGLVVVTRITTVVMVCVGIMGGCAGLLLGSHGDSSLLVEYQIAGRPLKLGKKRGVTAA